MSVKGEKMEARWRNEGRKEGVGRREMVLGRKKWRWGGDKRCGGRKNEASGGGAVNGEKGSVYGEQLQTARRGDGAGGGGIYLYFRHQRSQRPAGRGTARASGPSSCCGGGSGRAAWPRRRPCGAWRRCSGRGGPGRGSVPAFLRQLSASPPGTLCLRRRGHGLGSCQRLLTCTRTHAHARTSAQGTRSDSRFVARLSACHGCKGRRGRVEHGDERTQRRRRQRRRGGVSVGSEHH